MADVVRLIDPFGDTTESCATSLSEFIAHKPETRPALIGTDEDCLLPAGGFLILVARGGKGKTTLTIDGCFHLASGIDWLGFKVQRPLRIVIIENEGPMEPFRRKLERKVKTWTHEMPGAIFIWTLDWGAFTVDDESVRKQLRAFVEQEHIDLVVGDPLDSLGIKGIGSPAETREFTARLVQVGLTKDVAFWLLHHPSKAEVEDELDQAAGAWGGRPDTMLNLSVQPGNRSRLSFPKVRWGGDQSRKTRILAFDSSTEGFAVVAQEKDRDLLGEVHDLLADGKLRTARQIANPTQPKNGKVIPGIGSRRELVESLLQTNPEVFCAISGKTVGRHPGAVFWTLPRFGSQVILPTAPEDEEVAPSLGAG